MPIFGRKEETIYCGVSSSQRKGTDETEVLTRIAFDKLEAAAIKEPILFGGIAVYCDCIKACDFRVSVTEGTEGRSGIERELRRIMTKTNFKKSYIGYGPRHLGIWGNAFIEWIYNKKENNIVDFCAHDPKTMNFMKNPDEFDKIWFDGRGEPKGYEQEIMGNKINFKDNIEMKHLSLNQINRGTMGFGYVEPVYQDIELKENIEHGKAELAFRRGYPLPKVRYGSDMAKPSKEMHDKAEGIMNDLVNEKTTGITYPYYFEVGYLEPPATNIAEDLNYAIKLQAAVLGCPVAILTQSGEAEGRATLETLVDFFEMRLSGMQDALQIKETLEKVLEINGYEAELEVQFGVLSQKSMKEQVMRIQRLTKVGLVDPKDDDIRAYVKKLLGIIKLPFHKKEKSL
jgi:hypothetical protein